MKVLDSLPKVLPKHIRAVIKHTFSKRQVKEGMKLYRDDLVLETKVIHGVIKGEVCSEWFDDDYDYDIFEDGEVDLTEIIFYQEAGEVLIDHSCTCSNQHMCPHVVATLYEVLDDDISKLTSPFDQLAIFSKDQLPLAKFLIGDESDGIAQPFDKDTLKNVKQWDAGKYRELDLINGNLLETLKRNKNRNSREIPYWYRIENTLLPSSELVIEATNANNYNQQNRVAVKIKYEKSAVFIKCESCKITSEYLCEHQYQLLLASLTTIELSGLLEGKLTYKRIAKLCVPRCASSVTLFEKYFDLYLLEDKLYTKPKQDNIMEAKWLSESLSKIENKRDKSKKGNDIEKNLKVGRTMKKAYLWTTTGYAETNAFLKFMSGPSLKTKEGIQRNERKVSFSPNNMPASQLKIAKKLFFETMETDPHKRFETVRDTILENLDLLNECYHYVVPDKGFHQSLSSAKTHLVKFHREQIKAKFYFKQLDGFIQASYLITLAGQPFDFDQVVFSNGIFCATEDSVYLFPGPEFEKIINLFQHQEELLIPYANENDFNKFVSSINKYYETEVAKDFEFQEVILENGVPTIFMREVGTFIIFEPRIVFGDVSVNAYDEDAFEWEGKLTKVKEEDRLFLIDFLKGLHPDFDNAVQVQDYVFLPIKELVNQNWFFNFSEACDDSGVTIKGQKELSKFKYSRHRANVQSHVVSGLDWFEVKMDVTFGKQKVPTADWIRALKAGESFVTLKDGTLGILPEEWLKQAKKIIASADVEKGEIRISKYRYNIIEDLFAEIDDDGLIEEVKEKKRKLASYNTNKKYKLPKTIKADLRAYQKDGFAWLNFLDHSGFGGILADDMGLGKTLQVISFLASIKKRGTNLVIVPRSLLFNWAAELDKFCPSLKYKINHGSSRAKVIGELLPVNIIITTYDTAVSDIEILKEFVFDYIVLDESQAIKNPNSKRYKALRLLQSNNKIAMTGTPIENNTMDLFAQLSFTSPGLLGSARNFKDGFAIPIDNNGDVEAAELLRKMIHPFILRRTKEQVAKDLPDKTESIIYCEMGAAQRKLYNNLKSKIKEDLEEAIEEKGFSKARFQMLDGLLRLRQMCNSPLLINKTFKGANANSVKIDILIQNLSEELDQHKALVFSQFTSLLAIVRSELDALGIKYAYLDGSTRDREKQVKYFQENTDIRIFLISIKAGNTGLNLTEADYVYILDPWWNPAVEAQAIDRTHRIGQTKQIFAYKLICKDSIEEKILKLQEKKKKLASDMIKTDESIFKALDKSSLMSLLE